MMWTNSRLLALAVSSTFVLASCSKSSPTAPLAVASVTIAGTTNLTVGHTSQLAATLKDRNGRVLTGRAVTWDSNNKPVATVSSSGLVSAVKAGTATISATSEGKIGTAPIVVQ